MTAAFLSRAIGAAGWGLDFAVISKGCDIWEIKKRVEKL
jgi:hypothetical protein